MGRDFLPKGWVKKLGLLKINLLPKKTTLLVKFFTKYHYDTLQLQQQAGLIITQVYRKSFFFAREKFDLCPLGQ
jgi:hypothetical protein